MLHGSDVNGSRDRYALPLPERLRVETRSAHEAIEQAIDLRGRCGTLEGYVDLLIRLRGFHRMFEESAGALIADPGFFEPRRKLHLLDADLRYLGVGLPPLISSKSDPELCYRTADDAYGGMYVLEGATLGGRLVGRFLAERHGLGPGRGASFHDGYGARTGAMWREFKLHLTDAASDDERVIAFARGTFRLLQNWLSGPAN